MAVVDREVAPLTFEERARLDEIEVGAERSAPTGGEPIWSMPGRILLATLSAGAGVIHLVMVPSHAEEWLPAGIAFALAGWLQIALAVAFVARPSRLALRVSCLANVVFIGAWAVSRIWGLPVGPDAGIPHAASFVDVVCVALEVVLVVAGYELLSRPGLGAKLSSAALVPLSIVPIGILVLATAAIASPSATGHAHGETAGSAAGHTHDDGVAAAAGDAGHDHAAATGDDKGLSLIMNGAGEGGGHVHDTSVVELDPATKALLDDELAKMKPLIDKYPTVKDAEAAGYTRQGPYSPALGAHYGENGGVGVVNLGPTMSSESLQHPMLIFDGIEPESKLAGFMYNIFSTDTANPPEGFVGPNDHWHYHTNVCIVPRADGGIDSPLGADSSATKELCDRYEGGILVANTGYMVHVWPVPGYESEQGLFSNLNPKLTCPDGTYYTVPMDEIGTRSNVCRDVAN